ncbi:hypothetical protein ABK040_012233 [Willaertia magna]
MSTTNGNSKLVSVKHLRMKKMSDNSNFNTNYFELRVYKDGNNNTETKGTESTSKRNKITKPCKTKKYLNNSNNNHYTSHAPSSVNYIENPTIPSPITNATVGDERGKDSISTCMYPSNSFGLPQQVYNSSPSGINNISPSVNMNNLTTNSNDKLSSLLFSNCTNNNKQLIETLLGVQRGRLITNGDTYANMLNGNREEELDRQFRWLLANDNSSLPLKPLNFEEIQREWALINNTKQNM